VDPATAPHFYDLPSTSLTDATVRPRITRTFTFDQSDGGWVINDRFMSCNQIRFTVQRNSIERWILQNKGGEWQHPIHIHLEEFQILRRGSRGSAAVEHSRKDVLSLNFDERAELFFRFRDFRGDYPLHCHNTLHEDHAMMLLFQVQDAGDNKTSP